MKKLARRFLLVIIILFIFQFFLFITNAYFVNISEKKTRELNLPVLAANSIKHAYAANLLYSTFRSIGIPSQSSENLVIFFGKANEVAEHELLSTERRDSTLEMMKDLGNNVAGIKSAELMEAFPEKYPSQRIDFIGDLAKNSLIFLSPDAVPLDEKDKLEATKNSSLKSAFTWADQNKVAIFNKITTNTER